MLRVLQWATEREFWSPKVCGHGGTIPGFSTEMYYLFEHDAVVVVNVNRLERDDKIQTTLITTAVVEALFPMPAK